MAISELKIGVVAEYDAVTMTAKVVSSDGASTEYRASPLLASLDYKAKSYKFEAPVAGNTCIYALAGTEAIILGYVLPPNLAPDNTDSSNNSLMSRAIDATIVEDHLPGDSIQRGKSGSKFRFLDTIYEVILSPMCKIVLNSIANIAEICARQLYVRSPGIELKSEVDTSGACNVNIAINRTESQLGGTPSINIKLGNTADLVNIGINGQPFLKVDGKRNVVLQGDLLTVSFKNVDFTPTSTVHFRR
jgi:hypothetical protein